MADYQLQGLPVWVYAKDVDTKTSLAYARLIEGAVGDPFSVDPEEFEGYKFVRSEGTLTGLFSAETMHTVTFYYRKASYAEIEQVSDKYLHFSVAVPTYAAIDDVEPLDNLVAGTYFKVAQRVVTRHGEFWYQLADTRWVKYNMKEMKLTSDNGQPAIPVEEWHRPTVWQPTPFSAMATVDFVPGQSTAVYVQPYGREIGRAVHGARVEITEMIKEASGVVWYHIAQQGWISGIYLKLD